MTLKPKSLFHHDMYRALVVVHEINVGKFLNTLQFIMALLILTPPVAQAEDMVIAADEVFLEVIIAL